MNTNTFSFTTRETYLEWVAAWRADYKQVSADIRAGKLATKDLQRGKMDPVLIAAFHQRHRQASRVADLLQQRAESKIEAGRQYQLSKGIQNAI